MRTISDTLEKAQQKGAIRPLVKLVLTHNSTTYTYTKTRILNVEYKENGNLQSAEITLHNRDKTLTDIDFRGYQGILSFGAVTTAGEEYSTCAPMYVVSQKFTSEPDELTCVLTLHGICSLMTEDKANQTYQPDDTDTKTVKTLIREIIGDTGVTMLSCFNHCQKYDIVFDGEDDLIDSYTPKDAYRIYLGNNRLSAINRLLDYTKCIMGAEEDGKLHVFVPTTSGEEYDYTYSLS